MGTSKSLLFYFESIAVALLLGMVVFTWQPLPAGASTLAQQTLTLVNQDQDFVDRHDNGGFVATPIFNTRPDFLAFAVKNPQDGSWLTAVYMVNSSPQKVADGWEYTLKYPPFADQPILDKNQAYILALFASYQGGVNTFEATIPIYQPTSLWDRVLNAFNPSTWARAFASWVVEGTHGLLCSVVERVTNSTLTSCSD